MSTYIYKPKSLTNYYYMLYNHYLIRAPDITPDVFGRNYIGISVWRKN